MTRTLVAAIMLILLIVFGYALDLVDVSSQIARGAIVKFLGVSVPVYDIVWAVKFLITLLALGLFMFILIRIAAAIRGRVYG